ncbi:MAG: hypothetical protein E7426_05550 [Ruminococcaceae bacterium]|jgi:hypothetical protein|nr:hypothetical protein [Oscillospiraceae bacterium]
MLFRKKIDPRCAYCVKGRDIGDGQVACVKKGIVAAEDHCASFVYDPLRRTPPRPLKLSAEKLKKEDFEV